MFDLSTPSHPRLPTCKEYYLPRFQGCFRSNATATRSLRAGDICLKSVFQKRHRYVSGNEGVFTVNNRMLGAILFSIALPLFSVPANADHGPEKMWKRQIQPYFTAHRTGKVGPFDVAIQSFGNEPTVAIPEIRVANFDRIFNDKVNLATIISKNNDYVYVRFNAKRGIDALTPMQGMSMSKTALGAAVGSLFCAGNIKSLDETMGQYTVSLQGTPYDKVTIRNVLQMNSGVTPLNRKDVRLVSRMAMGMGKFAGKASVLSAVQHFGKSLRDQGSKHNYHAADSFALSVLISDVTGKSASQIFYENVFSRFASESQMHWAADNDGRTVSQARLVMTPVSWHEFGQFILKEISDETCLGNYFADGINRAVPTHREGVTYGYQFWVYVLDNEPVLTMTGHGGFFNMLRRSNQSVMSVFSVDPEYQAGNLFGKGVLANIGERVLE